jgi:small conductance mechanosensitive channel
MENILSTQGFSVQVATSLVAAATIYLLAGLLVVLFAHPLARLLLGLARISPSHRRLTGERRRTLEGLIASLIALLAMVVAIVATLSLFVPSQTLIWIVGLFSAAFGLGARGMVADFVAGGSFIFHNTFAIGEKIEFYSGMNRVEGIVEAVNVRNTQVRAPTGELFTVPNGEIGVVRNFTRANLSAVKIKLMVPSEALGRALDLLDALGQEAVALLPELREPWQVISTTDAAGPCTEVTVLASSRYGQAAPLRLRLIALIYERLLAEGITLRECRRGRATGGHGEGETEGHGDRETGRRGESTYENAKQRLPCGLRCRAN